MLSQGYSFAFLAGFIGGVWIGGLMQLIAYLAKRIQSGEARRKLFYEMLYYFFMALGVLAFLIRVGLFSFLYSSYGEIFRLMITYFDLVLFFFIVLLVTSIITYKYASFPK